MRKVLLISLVLALVASIGLQAQGIVPCYPKEGYSQTYPLGNDSATFISKFMFNIPEGCKTDTLHLLFWGYSSDGAMDVDITSHFGTKKPGTQTRDVADYLMQDDSVAVATTFTTESYLTGWTIVPAAKDTTLTDDPAGSSRNILWMDAVQINVKGGGTNNNADLDFYLKLMAEEAHTNP